MASARCETLAITQLPTSCTKLLDKYAANIASGHIPAKLGYAKIGERPARELWPAAPGDAGTDVVWQFTR